MNVVNNSKLIIFYFAILTISLRVNFCHPVNLLLSLFPNFRR